jgi:transaldolase
MSAAATRTQCEPLRPAPAPCVALFFDGANLHEMSACARSGLADGFTTNPTLMRQSGVRSYAEFAARALAFIGDAPISLPVLCDDLPGMLRQARIIAGWGPNVNVKVPACTPSGKPTWTVVRRLTEDGISVNVTAVMTLEQVAAAAAAVAPGVASFVSVFAGRIADTGRDPVPVMREAVAACADNPRLRVIWASPREALNVYQADACGVHVIVLSSDLLAKLVLRDRDLLDFSRETVSMFYHDALAAGYTI